jgi:NTE family protein
LDSIASRHVGSLPMPIKTLLSTIGATERRGGALASYLLFEGSYTRSLIELGQVDTLSRRDEVLRFFDIDTTTKKILKRKYTDEIFHDYKKSRTQAA